jgi:preprotein translocase subunit SecD
MKTTLTLLAIITIAVTTAFSQTTLRFSGVCTKDDTQDSVEMIMAGKGEKLIVKKAAILTENDVQSAIPVNNNGNVGIELTLNPEGIKRFSDALPSLYQKRMAIIIDDKLVSAPRILLKKATTKMEIEGNFSIEEANNVALKINKAEPGAAANASRR